MAKVTVKEGMLWRSLKKPDLVPVNSMCLEIWSTYIPWVLVQETLRASGGDQM